jgi:hypothetical protein
MESRSELLAALLRDVRDLVPGDVEAGEHLRRRVLMVLRNLYGDTRKPYEANVTNVRFDTARVVSEATRGNYRFFVRSRDRLASILETALEEERLFATAATDAEDPPRVPSFETAAEAAGASETSEPNAFVLMPFHEDFEWLYSEIRTAGENAGVRTERADDIFSAGIVIDQVKARIQEADVVIAVCTGRNANVFYELGIAETIHRPILIGETSNDLPFDIQHFRAQFYEGDQRATLHQRVARAIRETLAERHQRAPRPTGP